MKFSIFSIVFLLVGFTLFSCKSKEKTTTEKAGEVAAATGQSYAVNTDQSIVLWEGAKKVGGKHNGDVKIKDGSLFMENGVLKSGSFTIDMTTINSTDVTGDDKKYLDAHLMGTAEGKETDFFNVPKYPTAKFELVNATKLMNNPDGNYIISGNLTIKDVTKQVKFKADVSESNGVIKASSSAFNIDRTEWGIKYGSSKFFDNLKDKVINDEMTFSVKIMASKK